MLDNTDPLNWEYSVHKDHISYVSEPTTLASEIRAREVKLEVATGEIAVRPLGVRVRVETSYNEWMNSIYIMDVSMSRQSLVTYFDNYASGYDNYDWRTFSGRYVTEG